MLYPEILQFEYAPSQETRQSSSSSLLWRFLHTGYWITGFWIDILSTYGFLFLNDSSGDILANECVQRITSNPVTKTASQHVNAWKRFFSRFTINIVAS